MVRLNQYCATAFPLPYSLLFFQNAMTVLLNFMFVQVRWRGCEDVMFKNFLLSHVTTNNAVVSERALDTCLVVK